MRAPSFVTRTLLTVVPAFLIGALALSTLLGGNGLLARRELQGELDEANRDLADLQRENQVLLRELRLMDSDRVVVERVVADELGWAPEGATLYTFEDGGPSGVDEPVQ